MDWADEAAQDLAVAFAYRRKRIATALRAAKAQGLEEAAKIVEENARFRNDSYGVNMTPALTVAASIRALAKDRTTGDSP